MRSRADADAHASAHDPGAHPLPRRSRLRSHWTTAARTLALLLAGPALAGCEGKPAPATTPPPPAVARPDTRAGVEVRVEASSPAERKRLQEAASLFQSTCSPLIAAWSDVDSATVRQVRVWESSPWAKLGWGEVAQVQVKVKRQPLDARLRSLQVGGVTLYYAIGGGRRPGIEAALPPARRLCDITEKDGWRSLPAAAGLGLSDKPSTFGGTK